MFVGSDSLAGCLKMMASAIDILSNTDAEVGNEGLERAEVSRPLILSSLKDREARPVMLVIRTSIARGMDTSEAVEVKDIVEID